MIIFLLFPLNLGDLTKITYALLLRENVDKKHNYLMRAADHIKLAKENPMNEREEAHFKVY